MALKKAFCCLSTRMGSLLFLYCFLMVCVCSVSSLLINWETLILMNAYKNFLRNDNNIFYATMAVQVVTLIGGSIFLATIVSILSNTPSVSLLWKTIALSSFITFCDIYLTFKIAANIVSDELAHNDLKNMAYFGVLMRGVLVLYAILVFHGYITELKENSIDAASAHPSQRCPE